MRADVKGSNIPSLRSLLVVEETMSSSGIFSTVLDVRKFSFGQKVVNHWNVLKQHAVDCNTVNSIQRSLDCCIKDRGFL